MNKDIGFRLSVFYCLCFRPLLVGPHHAVSFTPFSHHALCILSSALFLSYSLSVFSQEDVLLQSMLQLTDTHKQVIHTNRFLYALLLLVIGSPSNHGRAVAVWFIALYRTVLYVLELYYLLIGAFLQGTPPHWWGQEESGVKRRWCTTVFLWYSFVTVLRHQSTPVLFSTFSYMKQRRF